MGEGCGRPSTGLMLKGLPTTFLLTVCWLSLFVLLPAIIIVRLSLSDAAAALPPYLPAWQGFRLIGDFLSGLDFETYKIVLGDELYITSFFTSLRLASYATFFTLLVGYPLALAIVRSPKQYHIPLLILIIIPFWTSFLIRIYAWIGILRTDGFLNHLLLWLGLINEPLALMYTDTAVIIGMVYAYLPFMVLPLYASLEKLDLSLLEAAADLGATPRHTFWRITLPLTKNGIIAGAALVFIPAVGEFVIPDLLGGSEILMIGKTIWTDFFSNRDWPIASTTALVMLLTIIVPFLLLQKWVSREEKA